MIKPKIHTIYSNYEEDYSFEAAKAECKYRHLENFPEDTNWEPSDEEVWEEINWQIEAEWDCIKDDVQQFFDKGNVFVLTGSAGRWNGRSAGGCIIRSFNDLAKAWQNVDYLKIYDDNGSFKIKGDHHDGTNNWSVRKLTQRGLEYLERHECDNPRKLHEKLWKNPYSVKVNYAKQVFGI